jgi:hypothetical protein
MAAHAGNNGNGTLRIAASSIVAGVVFVAPAAAPAGQSGGERPIRIERCAVESRTLLTDPFNSIRTNLVTGISVRFTNLRDVAATRLTIVVRYAGSSESIAERGAFAGGRPFDRTVPAFTGDAYAGASADCRLASAAFADGTTWDSSI